MKTVSAGPRLFLGSDNPEWPDGTLTFNGEILEFIVFLEHLRLLLLLGLLGGVGLGLGLSGIGHFVCEVV